MSDRDPREPSRTFVDSATAIAKGMGTVWKQTFRRDNTEPVSYTHLTLPTN